MPTKRNPPGTKINKLGAKRPATYVRKPPSDTDLVVLQLACSGLSKRAVGRILNINESKVRQVLIDHHKLEESMIAERAKALADRQIQKEIGMLDILDEEAMQMAVHGEGKGKTGRLRAVNLGYQRLKLIDAPGAKIVQNAQANAGAQVTGTTAFEVYESMWLRDRKAAWSKQLEQKHGNSPT